MSGNKYENFKIPVLKKTEYSTWRVKMLMYLEASDPDYIDRINDGPYLPRKIVPQTATEPEQFIIKEKTEWSAEDKIEVLKDVKVKTILYNSLDHVMSNRVIACRTSKEIWDTLEIQCQGTKEIKKNRRAVLVQEYEYFEAKSDESLTDVYDRFLTLLNELALVGQIYPNEFSNTKFLRSLPEEWDVQTSIIRYGNDLETVTLDELYGMLKTHDLELQQRKNRKSNKVKHVALKVDSKLEKANEKNSTVSRRKGKEVASPDDSNTDSESDTDENSNPDGSSEDDMMQMMAMIVRGLKKMKFRSQRRKENFTKKFPTSEGKDRFRKREGKNYKADKVDKSKIKCFNYDGVGHYANECRKPKAGKGESKALISSSKSWLDESDSEEEEENNYALMAEFEDAAPITEKVPLNCYGFDIDNMSELKSFLKSLHMNFKNQSLENARLINELNDLKKKNEFLESELTCLTETQKECETAKHRQSIISSHCESLKEELKKERDIIKVWTRSGRTTHEVLYNNKWKKGLGYTDEEKDDYPETMFQPVRPLSVPVNFVNYKPTHKSEITKIDESDLEKPKSSIPNSVKSEIPIVKNVTKIYRVKEKNIGLLSKGTLEKKINNITGKIKTKAPKRNRNGKQGIDRTNNYAYIQNAPRKTCFNCGNTNHLAIDCRKAKKTPVEVSSSDIRSRLVNYKPQNPCSHCGSKWHSIFLCNEYHSLFHNNYEPLPKFYQKVDSKKTVNVSMKSTTSNLCNKPAESNNNIINGFYWRKKSSAVHENKLSKKRIQQVWIQKQSN